MATPHDSKALRSAMGCFTTGVAVIATRKDERHIGFTANSLTSVSLSPPLMLFCISKARSSYEAVAVAEAFTINVLSASQRRISERFATSADNKWAGVDYKEDRFGNPLLRGAAAAFSCRKREIIEAGDHIIVLVEVDAFEQDSDPSPLVYCRSQYCLPGEAAA